MRKPLATTTTRSTIPPLDEFLEYVQHRRLVLCVEPDGVVDLFTSEKQPVCVRRAIYKYRAILLHKLATGDVKLCPTHLHKKHHRNGTCYACKRLDDALGVYEQQEQTRIAS